MYRESLKIGDLEDDLGTFNRHFRKKERSLIKPSKGKTIVMLLEFTELFNRDLVY